MIPQKYIRFFPVFYEIFMILFVFISSFCIQTFYFIYFIQKRPNSIYTLVIIKGDCSHLLIAYVIPKLCVGTQQRKNIHYTEGNKQNKNQNKIQNEM